MRAALPMLQAMPVLKGKDYREVLRQELDAGKIPISLGRSCPVQCEFCYELDHSYRETLEPPKTTQEDWEFILDYINKKPTDPLQFWCLGGNEYMEWTDLFLHPKAMEWVKTFSGTPTRTFSSLRSASSMSPRSTSSRPSTPAGSI